MIRYLGNMVFGLGGTQELSLPMMTVLRRLALFAILNFKNLFFNQVLNTHDYDRRVLHLKGFFIQPSKRITLTIDFKSFFGHSLMFI